MRILIFTLLLGHCFGIAAHPLSHHQLERLDERLEEDPDSQYLYIQRGITFMENQQGEQALAQFHHAETLGDPLNVAMALGIFYYRQQDFDTSRQYFDRFIAANPHQLSAIEYRGRMLNDAGETEAALQDYLHFLKFADAPDPGRYIAAADIMLQLPEYGYQSALAVLDQGLAKNSQSSQLQRYAIKLELQQDNIAGAISRLNALPEKIRNTPDWKYETGLLHQQLGEKDVAREYFNTALKQLETLKPTGARRKLAQQLSEALGQLG